MDTRIYRKYIVRLMKRLARWAEFSPYNVGMSHSALVARADMLAVRYGRMYGAGR